MRNISQIGNHPQIGVKITTYLKPQPSLDGLELSKNIDHLPFLGRSFEPVRVGLPYFEGETRGGSCCGRLVVSLDRMLLSAVGDVN